MADIATIRFACYRMCSNCAQGLPFSEDRSGDHFFHVVDPGPPEVTIGCSAAPLHKWIEQLSPDQEEKR
jgi:hypothetical protein